VVPYERTTMATGKREYILELISTDLITNLLFYHRTEDGNLPVGAIEATIASGELTVDELAEAFAQGLRKAIP
jgi:hypothetical protein